MNIRDDSNENNSVFLEIFHTFFRYLSPAAEEARDYLAKVLGRNPLLITEMDLSRNKLGDLDVEKLSALLTDSHSRVEKIK